jgi:hypothetical protein
VSVTVANRGPGDLNGFTIFVQVRNLTSRSEMIASSVQSLRVGATTTVETSSFMVESQETVQAIVDPLGGVPEAERSNNLTQVVLTVPPTLTPTVTDPARVPPS